jgi:hypothetical protein
MPPKYQNAFVPEIVGVDCANMHGTHAKHIATDKTTKSVCFMTGPYHYCVKDVFRTFAAFRNDVEIYVSKADKLCDFSNRRRTRGSVLNVRLQMLAMAERSRYSQRVRSNCREIQRQLDISPRVLEWVDH